MFRGTVSRSGMRDERLKRVLTGRSSIVPSSGSRSEGKIERRRPLECPRLEILVQMNKRDRFLKLGQYDSGCATPTVLIPIASRPGGFRRRSPLETDNSTCSESIP